MFRIKSIAPVLAAFFFLVQPLKAEEGPVGNWNIKVKVGHVGEGIRVVVLQVKESSAGFTAMMSKLNGRMDDVDELTYNKENGSLAMTFGSYEYNLMFEGDSLRGTVMSPTGEQTVTGSRQDSLRLHGDAVEPLRRSWTGTIQNLDGTLLLKTRRGFDTYFVNADEFMDQLKEFEGKSIRVTGWWIKTKIKIQKLEAPPPGR